MVTSDADVFSVFGSSAAGTSSTLASAISTIEASVSREPSESTMSGCGTSTIGSSETEKASDASGASSLSGAKSWTTPEMSWSPTGSEMVAATHQESVLDNQKHL